VEVLNHLRCHKILLRRPPSNEGSSERWELWLPEERNYIPCRVRYFTSDRPGSLPRGEGNVLDFLELKPGIWIPQVADLTAFDTTVDERQSREPIADRGPKLRWKREFVLERAELNPTYSKAFFRDITFPKGAAVYEVSFDNKITRSYFVGAPGTLSKGSSAGRTRLWLLVAGNVCFATVVAVFLKSRKKRSLPVRTSD